MCEGNHTSNTDNESFLTCFFLFVFSFAANEKSHPPKLDDKVHRLEEIAINGIYCKRLVEKGIKTVKDFLKALNKDPDNLANVQSLFRHILSSPLLISITSSPFLGVCRFST
jgi:hypothetical protein